MTSIEAVAQHRAAIEKKAMSLSALRDQLSKIGSEAYEHRNWLNGWGHKDAAQARGLSGELERRRAELSRLTEEGATVQEKCKALEQELLTLREKSFDPADILAERAESYRSAVRDWEAAVAEQDRLVNGEAEATLQCTNAAAQLERAKRKLDSALTIDEVTDSGKAVSEAEQHKASLESLAANLRKALSRAKEIRKAAASVALKLEREVLSAKVDADLAALRNMPDFNAVRSMLELTFAASCRSGRGYDFGRFLAAGFQAESQAAGDSGARMRELHAQNARELGIVEIVEDGA